MEKIILRGGGSRRKKQLGENLTRPHRKTVILPGTSPEKIVKGAFQNPDCGSQAVGKRKKNNLKSLRHQHKKNGSKFTKSGFSYSGENQAQKTERRRA